MAEATGNAAEGAKDAGNKALSKMDDKVKTIKLPGEADDKCCWCFPIKCGVITIGVFMCLYALSLIITMIQWIGYGGGWVVWGVLYGIACAPIVIGAVFFVRYFMKMDDADRKAGTTKACLCVIVSAVLCFILSILVFIIVEGATFSFVGNQLVSSLITSLLYFYYAGVTKRLP